jgi:putative endonuclease
MQRFDSVRLEDAPPKYSERRRTGDAAEARAADWLIEKGWEVLARNVLYRDGELDLVAKKGGLYAFIEVRMRSHAAFGDPSATVTFAKQRRVVRAAMRWLLRERLLDRVDVRFDVIAVTGQGRNVQLEHIENAFDAGG